jgi:hypothetical protein
MNSLPCSSQAIPPQLQQPQIFVEGESEELDKERAEEFHTFVAKGLFACKLARPDIIQQLQFCALV